MKKFKEFSTRHPYLFMVVIFPLIPYILILLQMGIAKLSGFTALGFRSFQDSTKVLAVLLYLLILWRFGWLRPAGFLSLGRWQAWMIMVAASVIELVLTISAIKGHFAWRNLTNLAGPPAYMLVGLFEEFAFRGLILGSIFGFLTARGMVSRLHRVSNVAAAWSRGDFSEFIHDPVGEKGDEISQLSIRLDNMARQLQLLLKRNKQVAVSEERNRLARELHDSAKQEALAASFQIGTALTLIDRDPKSAKSHLEEADHLVDSVRGELTDLIHELRPPSMEGTRFDETIQEYMVEWAHQTGIKCSLDLDGYVDLSLEIKQAIYRIMQEALANVARHSSAEEVQAALRFREGLVEFCLRDDGRGFDIREHHNGMGLDSMRERAEAHEGHFRIESEAGMGTEVCLTFPIE